MQMTIEGCVAFGSPLYVGTPAMVATMQKCDHKFQRESEIPSPHPDTTLTIETCACGASRFRLEAVSEERLKEVLQ